MDREVLVKVEGLSKKFSKSLKKSLKYGVYDLLGNLRGKKSSDELRPDEFYALQDINFEVRRGECLGLIGHNGAGKSTLLKILNGLINPDHGKVTMRGRVGALIELGAGFNPIMTGRENIYNNGAVLGFSKEEIDRKVESIIDFAEIREFIDMPVQNYSSGMKVRLGFSVAAQMEPDILLIDEVLAVGDLGFVLKCFKQIDTILPNTALVFVSHSMPMVSRIATQILMLDSGKTKFIGSQVSQGIDLYYERFQTGNESNIVFDDGQIALDSVTLLNVENSLTDLPKLNWNSDFIIKIKFNTSSDNINFQFTLIISDKEQRPVASFLRNSSTQQLLIKKNKLELTLRHKNLQLSKGIYSISIAVRDIKTKQPIYRSNSCFNFQIINTDQVWEPMLLNAEYIVDNSSTI
ncbi:ATP-binding cassette domain-containing protein [Dokdonia sinensis]|uniref:ATP-binding cassette domain-containing protein n=1 Tax=Dokdonia sinensis TaxID=2479847 RepID=A0A3M0G5C4_9FLAO|nr:ABC transporter ATP-binding protein [Dokdonia sinensis]RMB57442.1 ATP-binding cassette domain-containing protein [Dokdonia sinensis]